MIETGRTGPPAPETSPPTPRHGLSGRELEVLEHLCDGGPTTINRIAKQLVISPNTVKNHIGGILTKMGAEDKGQAIALAYLEGIVTAPQRINRL